MAKFIMKNHLVNEADQTHEFVLFEMSANTEKDSPDIYFITCTTDEAKAAYLDTGWTSISPAEAVRRGWLG